MMYKCVWGGAWGGPCGHCSRCGCGCGELKDWVAIGRKSSCPTSPSPPTHTPSSGHHGNKTMLPGSLEFDRWTWPRSRREGGGGPDGHGLGQGGREGGRGWAGGREGGGGPVGLAITPLCSGGGEVHVVVRGAGQQVRGTGEARRL